MTIDIHSLLEKNPIRKEPFCLKYPRMNYPKFI